LTPPLHFAFPLITDQRPLTRARGGEEDFAPPADVVSFWHNLWVERQSPFYEEAVLRSDDVVEDEDTGTMTVIRALPGSFYAGSILKRDEYDLALTDLEALCESMNAVVIVGHPGIGRMSIF
jgi:hypothetical protein